MDKIKECNTKSGQHYWIPVANKSGKGMQCYSCPMCKQKIYWSAILQDWVNVTIPEKVKEKEEVEKGGSLED